MILPADAPRGLIKPAGMPLVRSGAVPRGLFLSAPLADPSYAALGYGSTGSQAFGQSIWPVNRGSAISAVNTALGPAVKFAGTNSSTNVLTYRARMPTSSVLSAEALLITPASGLTSNFACEINNASNGVGVNEEAFLWINSTGHFEFGVVNGGSAVRAIDSGTPAASTLYHLVGTSDGSNVRLYVNGVLKATTAGLASFSYSDAYVAVGGVGSTASSQTILLVNYAESAWTPAEVLARYSDPFGFMSFPDDELKALLVGQAITGRLYRAAQLNGLGGGGQLFSNPLG